MIKEIVMNKKLSKNITGTITGLIGLLVVSTSPLAAPGINGGKPAEVSGFFDIPANTVKPGACAFDVRVAFDGKGKTITLPGNRSISTSPGLNAEVTNLSDPTKTVNLNVTGAFHQTSKSNGDIVTIVTGRNFLTDPLAGVVLAIGTFRFAFDASNNLIEPLNGQGQLINICDLIS